jgi:hypothetical protein
MWDLGNAQGAGTPEQTLHKNKLGLGQSTRRIKGKWKLHLERGPMARNRQIHSLNLVRTLSQVLSKLKICTELQSLVEAK